MIPPKSLLSLWLLACAIGCKKDGDGDATDVVGDDDDTIDATGDTSAHTGTPGDLTVTATIAASTFVPTAFQVTVTAEEPGEAWLEFGLDGALDRVSPTSAAAASHTLSMLGLKANRNYSWRAAVSTASGVSYSPTQTLAVPAAPPPLAATSLVSSTAAANIPFVLYSVIGRGGSFAVVVDIDGDIVWWRPTLDPKNIIITPIQSRDGLSFMWGEYDSGKDLDNGRMYRVRVDGTEITDTRMLASHHSAIEKPDGTLGWLGLDFRTIQIDSKLSANMFTDRIFEGPEGAADDHVPVEIFNHFDQQDPPVLTCDHIGPTDRFGYDGYIEWTHANSLAYVDSEDAYYLNAKQTDWVIKVDATSGEMLWQLNGIGGDFTLPNGDPVWTSAYEPTLFSHAHMSQVWEGGMVTFDNGDHRTPRISSAAELAWDEVSMTAERVWEFYHPEGQSSYPLGDVRKLDDGSYLVGWGELSEIMQVTADHEVVWHLEVPPDYTVARVLPLYDLYDVTP